MAQAAVGNLKEAAEKKMYEIADAEDEYHKVKQKRDESSGEEEDSFERRQKERYRLLNQDKLYENQNSEEEEKEEETDRCDGQPSQQKFNKL